MARGRVGGTRSKVRGAVGSEIYTIGKDGEGRLTQIVSARPDSRAYSNTPAQAKNRCIMGMIHRMFHFLPDYIRQGYSGIPEGTLSFQHFAKINYNNLRKDFEEHFSGDNVFSWKKKHVLIPPAGPWILIQSDLPAFKINGRIVGDALGCMFDFDTFGVSGHITLGEALNQWGLKLNDRLHVVVFSTNVETGEVRLHDFVYQVNPQLPVNMYLDEDWKMPLFLTSWTSIEPWELDYEKGIIRFVVDDGDIYAGWQCMDVGVFVETRSESTIQLTSCQFQDVFIRFRPRVDRVPAEWIFDSWLNNG